MTCDTGPDPNPVHRFVAALADNKLFLGRRYAEWCTAAPTLESAVAAAAMAQDEIGHARSLYPLLRELTGTSPETEPETRTVFFALPFLCQPFSEWTDFVAANFILDTAFSVALEAARTSSLTELASRARRILEEEPFHWLHGEGWTRRLAERGQGVRAALQDSLDRATPDAGAWFALAPAALVENGTLNLDGSALSQRFRERINEILAPSELRQL